MSEAIDDIVAILDKAIAENKNNKVRRDRIRAFKMACVELNRVMLECVPEFDKAVIERKLNEVWMLIR